MRTVLLTLGSASLLFLSASCRTLVPIDPNTGQRSCRMMPDKPTCCSIDCKPCCKGKTEVKPSK